MTPPNTVSERDAVMRERAASAKARCAAFFTAGVSGHSAFHPMTAHLLTGLIVVAAVGACLGFLLGAFFCSKAVRDSEDYLAGCAECRDRAGEGE